MDDAQRSGNEDCFPGCSSVHQRISEPESSCVSMKSDASMGHPVHFKSGDTRTVLSSVLQKRSEPESSCVSMKSDASMGHPIHFKSGDTQTGLSSVHQRRSGPEPSCVSMKSDMSIDQPIHIKSGNSQTGLSHKASSLNTFRSNLRKKFQCLNEGTATQGNATLLNEIYTELYITESESGEINNEHEVRQIETQSRREATEDTPIKCNDIFRPLPGQDKPIRTVLTKGVAGIGKTVSVQKFILDWAEGKENQDIQLIFPLPFRELNLMKDKTLSLSDLLHVFFPETKEMEISSDEYKVLFIFDGLDECRLSVNFKSKVKLCNISESASVDELLMNLIVGNLLPSALIWITSRPAAADLVPSECVHRVTEVRGFNEPQKEEYFRKKISDQSLANTVISHLKSSRSLFIMCHIPVFCWISATVLEKMLSEAERGEIPKTLTQMYTHFLIIQTNIKHEKDYKKKVKDEDMILKLGNLAFRQLVKGNLIFYEEDLRECGIDVTEASVYSGLCTQIFREELGLHQGKVFCFVHLSIQEHLAALYAHIYCTNKKRNVFEKAKQNLFSKISNQKKYYSLSKLHQRAVDETLQSKNGHLDLFLRFLLGLSLKSNQTLLRKLLKQTGSCSYNEETVQYIKQKITENLSPERSINLFHCLNELGDDLLMQEIQRYLTSGKIRETKLSSSQWSALVYVLLTSEQTMDVFYLKQFIGEENTADEVLQKLLPVVKESRSAQLSGCMVTEKGCGYLSSALSSNPSHLRELDLSYNHPGDSGVKLLSDKLNHPNYRLDKLKLQFCNLTAQSCKSLSSALQSSNMFLRELDLSNNDLQDSGVKLLSDGLKTPNCQLQILRLSGCMVTEEGCGYVSSALSSNPSHLRELDLSYNHPGDSGVKLLSDKLNHPNYRLDKLNVDHGGEIRIRAGIRKYSHRLTLDLNTVNKLLLLSESKRVITRTVTPQSYPDHSDRFNYHQVLCRESVCDRRCYWEIEWSGHVHISVSYKNISRKGRGYECWFGYNDQSWSLTCSSSSYSFWHNKIKTDLPVKPISSRRTVVNEEDHYRTGVFVDHSAGTLSFYSVSGDTMILIHTVQTTFTQPLYPGFWVYYYESSVKLCR
ncbi:NLR family CARD domain-containing protein 3-like [Chanodichthys erythropterus]|uniref:NLR family CARD domain-containing protein 3-like n=1 Tax=Chanodichthys erythropterus TaxID=933992 RepID=UPI00351DE9B5